MRREYIAAVELSSSVVFGVVAGWVLSQHVQHRPLKVLLPVLGVVLGFLAGLVRVVRGVME
ncbi:hypothetical protein [Methanopyrus sp.]